MRIEKQQQALGPVRFDERAEEELQRACNHVAGIYIVGLVSRQKRFKPKKQTNALKCTRRGAKQ